MSLMQKFKAKYVVDDEQCDDRFESFFCFVPRESYIKEVTNLHFDKLSNERKIDFVPYNGVDYHEVHESMSDEQIHEKSKTDLRLSHLTQISKLKYFRMGSISEMNKGVCSYRMPNVYDPRYVGRCIMIMSRESSDVIGAVYFTVNLKSKNGYVDIISVNDAFQKQGYGSILLDYALISLSLYGCANISVAADRNVIGFWVKYGFSYHDRSSKETYSDVKAIEERCKFESVDLSLDLSVYQYACVLNDRLTRNHPGLDIIDLANKHREHLKKFDDSQSEESKGSEQEDASLIETKTSTILYNHTQEADREKLSLSIDKEYESGKNRRDSVLGR